MLFGAVAHLAASRLHRGAAGGCVHHADPHRLIDLYAIAIDVVCIVELAVRHFWPTSRQGSEGEWAAITLHHHTTTPTNTPSSEGLVITIPM